MEPHSKISLMQPETSRGLVLHSDQAVSGTLQIKLYTKHRCNFAEGLQLLIAICETQQLKNSQRNWQGALSVGNVAHQREVVKVRFPTQPSIESKKVQETADPKKVLAAAPNGNVRIKKQEGLLWCQSIHKDSRAAVCMLLSCQRKYPRHQRQPCSTKDAHDLGRPHHRSKQKRPLPKAACTSQASQAPKNVFHRSGDLVA